MKATADSPRQYYLDRVRRVCDGADTSRQVAFSARLLRAPHENYGIDVPPTILVLIQADGKDNASPTRKRPRFRVAEKPG